MSFQTEPWGFQGRTKDGDNYRQSIFLALTRGLTPTQVRNLGKPVELAGRYFKEGADEVTFLNITGFRDFPLADMPMLEVSFSIQGSVPPFTSFVFSSQGLHLLCFRVGI